MRVFVKMGLTSLSVLKKIAKSRFILINMTGNPHFISPNPPLSAIATATDNLEAANLAGAGPERVAVRRKKEEKLDMLIKQLAGYVEAIANADLVSAETVILSSGFDLKKKGIRSTEEFYAAATGRRGEAKLYRKAVKRGTYHFQMCTDLTNNSWETIYEGTRGTFFMRDLKPNCLYYFRVKVITNAGPSKWSVVCSVFITV